MKKTDCYTITEMARELGVTRQTVYYWIKKKWVEPKRDYRNYPVFTKTDIGHIKKWLTKLRVPDTKPTAAVKWQDLQHILYK